MDTKGKVNPGSHFRENVAKIGNFAMIPINASLYLHDYETQSWLLLCRMANMTIYNDGEFDMKLDRLINESGASKRTEITIIQSLLKIGYIRRHKIGRSYRYRFDFDSMKIMSDIVTLNPGIGHQLRGLRGDSPVVSIKNSEIEKACKNAGKEFTYCGFLDR